MDTDRTSRPCKGRGPRHQLLVLIAGLTLVLGLLLWPNWRNLRSLEARTTAMDADIARLEQGIAQYTAEREKLRSDPTYVERVARQAFHSTRHGEILFKIEPSPTAGESPHDTNRR